MVSSSPLISASGSEEGKPLIVITGTMAVVVADVVLARYREVPWPSAVGRWREPAAGFQGGTFRMTEPPDETGI